MAKTSRFKTPYNGLTQGSPGEKNSGLSLTIPDQTMSVQTLLERHSRGLNIGGSRSPIYDGEDDFFPDLSKMDLVDRADFIQDKKDELEAIKERHKARERSKRMPPAGEKAEPDKSVPMLNSPAGEAKIAPAQNTGA